jgi:hypothetical protein
MECIARRDSSWSCLVLSASRLRSGPPQKNVGPFRQTHDNPKRWRKYLDPRQRECAARRPNRKTGAADAERRFCSWPAVVHNVFPSSPSRFYSARSGRFCVWRGRARPLQFLQRLYRRVPPKAEYQGGGGACDPHGWIGFVGRSQRRYSLRHFLGREACGCGPGRTRFRAGSRYHPRSNRLAYIDHSFPLSSLKSVVGNLGDVFFTSNTAHFDSALTKLFALAPEPRRTCYGLELKVLPA